MANTKIKFLLFSNYLSLFSFYFFNPIFAIFVVERGMKPEQAALALAINNLAAAVMIILFGKFEDKRKNKVKIISLGYFVLAIAALSYLFVHNFMELAAAQVLNALGLGIYLPALRTTYALSEDQGKETLEWSFVDGGGRFFMAAGAAVGGILYKFYGFKTIFVLIAAIELMASYVVLKTPRK